MPDSMHKYLFNDLSQLNSLIDNMNELFYIYDTKGIITFINKKSYDILGYHPEEIVGKYLPDLVPARYREVFVKGLPLRIKAGEKGTYIAVGVHKDGTEKVIRHNAAPIFRKGQIIGEMVLADDITEQVKAEEALSQYTLKLESMSEELVASNEQLLAIEEELRQQLDESENNKDALADAHQQLEMLLDFLPDPTFAINTQGQITIWNQAMEKLTGLKVRDMLGKGNYEYAIPFYGNRRPITIDLVLTDISKAKDYYNVFSINNDTLFTEEYCPQLGVSGAFLANKSAPLVDRKGNIIGAIQTIQDITENKAQEIAIRESEEKYRNIIQTLDDGYFEVDISGYFTFFNKFLHQTVGYALNELMGMSYRKVMDEENGERVLRTFNRVYTTGKPVKEFGWYVTRKDGAKLYVETTVMPIFENGKIMGFKGLVRDITEKRKAEEALRKSEETLKQQVNYLNTLINNLNEFFLTYDINGRISFINKRSYDLLGYYPEELLGTKVIDLIVEDHRLLVIGSIQKRITYGGENTYELPLIHKNGNTRLIKLNASPILDDKGNITGGMVLAEDITAKKMAEEQLRFSEARYRAIVEDQTELICRSLPNGSVTFVNNAYCRYFGIEKNQAYGSKLADIIYSEDWELVKQCLDSLTVENPVKSMEIRVILPNGDIRWLNCVHRAIYNDFGVLNDYQSVGSDITERKFAEDKLHYLSRHDTLTGLFNRFYFEEQMKHFGNNNMLPMGLIMCDVDGLKLVNDTLGHDEGDELLKAATHVISKAFRKSDIVARVGGDEFAILLPYSEQPIIEAAVIRIKEYIELYNAKQPKVNLSISIGYAMRCDDNASMQELYQEADNNMYREKLNGGQGARSLIVQTLMKALEDRDYITEGHGDRMRDIVVMMGKALNLSNKKINILKMLAQFHDIGKVGVPDSIIFKQGALTPDEYTIMKRHSEIGHRIALSASELMMIADGILKHHEWWDGNGYPLALCGETIPLECRILAIADAYDSMTNDRPYRKAISQQEAVKELINNAGSQFDPVLVDLFVQLIENNQDNQDNEDDNKG